MPVLNRIPMVNRLERIKDNGFATGAIGYSLVGKQRFAKNPIIQTSVWVVLRSFL